MTWLPTPENIAAFDSAISFRHRQYAKVADHRIAETLAKEGKLPVSLLLETFNYDKLTGILTWKRAMTGKGNWLKRENAVAGSKAENGYIVVHAAGRVFQAHRIAWAIVTGAWPVRQIDHKDLCRSNNRFDNLREVSNRENHANRSNNTSGTVGVMYEKSRSRWKAYIKVGHIMHNIGRYDTKEDAAAARQTYLERLVVLGHIDPVSTT